MYKHIIHKQKVVLDIEEQRDAFDYQNKISMLFNNGLQIAIENILDEMSQPDEVTRIESLKLDLGIIGKRNFEKEFENKLISSLRNAIIVSKNSSTDGTNNVTVTKPAASQREAFIYFLTYGKLPWYCNIRNSEAWQRELFEQWKEEDWELIVTWIKKQYAVQPNIVDRLVLQFNNEFLAPFAEHIWLGLPGSRDINVTSWKSVMHDIFKIASGILTDGIAGIKSDLWRTVFEVLLRTENTATGKDIAGIILSQVFSNSEDNFSGLAMRCNEILQQMETPVVKDILLVIIDAMKQGYSLSAIKELLARRTLTAFANEDASLNPDVQAKEKAGGVLNISVQADINTAGVTIKPTNGEVRNDEEDVEYVGNCGLILLHPFLGAYFADLGLILNKQFIDKAAQQRAVLLLYYLATGEKEAAEFNVVLQKLMCGYALEETLVTSVELSIKEIEESHQLLRTVIDYWPPLKNTSVGGFQTTFLQREGKLSRIESGWLLQIEQKTVDILLGKLPWGFSTIKLPWMREMINVEWA